MKLQTLSPHWSRQAFFVKGVGLVQSCPVHSSHIQLCSWQPTDASASILITFFFFFFKRPEIANKGFVKKPWPLCHQCSPSCLCLKFCFLFPWLWGSLFLCVWGFCVQQLGNSCGSQGPLRAWGSIQSKWEHVSVFSLLAAFQAVCNSISNSSWWQKAKRGCGTSNPNPFSLSLSPSCYVLNSPWSNETF